MKTECFFAGQVSANEVRLRGHSWGRFCPLYSNKQLTFGYDQGHVSRDGNCQFSSWCYVLFFCKGELSGASLPFIMNFGLVHVVFSLGRRFLPPPIQKVVNWDLKAFTQKPMSVSTHLQTSAHNDSTLWRANEALKICKLEKKQKKKPNR